MSKFNQIISTYILEAESKKDSKSTDKKYTQSIPLPSIIFSRSFNVEDAIKAMFVFLNFSIIPIDFKNGLKIFLNNKEQYITYDKKLASDQTINSFYSYFVDVINGYFDIEHKKETGIRFNTYFNTYGAENFYSIKDLQEAFKTITLYLQSDSEKIKTKVDALVQYPKEQQAQNIFKDGTNITYFLKYSKNGLEILSANLKKFKVKLQPNEFDKTYKEKSKKYKGYEERPLWKDILIPKELTVSRGYNPSIQYREIPWKNIFNSLRGQQKEETEEVDLNKLRKDLSDIFAKK